ncbi:Up in starvation [Sporothrix epigloea]|uniref:Up in starvation n=1 Tax=Sporothrix epigloea TaxID=1892477 RepID=A0ABP0DTT2_9PEZI
MDSVMRDNSKPVPADGPLARQMPLPEAVTATTNKHNRTSTNNGSGEPDGNHTSTQMQQSHSQGSKSTAATSHSDEAGDIKMSDNESITDETTSKSGRKKKSQRFYCTEFPSCNLSFTRSEHLARHIRKHTGERPFECHCQRRFSRLDNLRQHAQTVHMHEEIPLGSLAATGTRFQRQIRPDRAVRAGPPNGRARPGSLSGPSRGHSKSFSTSNIALGSGSYGVHDDVREMRPRPIPLMIDPRVRQHQTDPRAYHATDETFRPMTPPEMVTPTSITFSNGPATPHWGGARGGSPFSSRHPSMYAPSESPSRRLSVPSSEAYYQSPSSALPPRGHLYSASASSNGGGFFSSPTQTSGRPGSSDFSSVSEWSRRESFSSTTDDRRRTWHPSSRDFRNPVTTPNGMPGGSEMSAAPGSLNAHHQLTGPQPPPPMTVAIRPDQQNNGVRLPGIDSFLQRPLSTERQAPAPVVAEVERYPPGPPQPVARSPNQHPSHQRPLSGNWDGLQNGLHRLDIAGQSPPQEPSQEWNQPLYPNDGRAPQTVRFDHEAAREDQMLQNNAGGSIAYNRGHQHTMSAPAYNMSTARQTKRQAWYDGAAAGGSAARVDRMVHPNLANGFSGFPGRGVPQTVHEHQPHEQDTYSHSRERSYEPYRRGLSPLQSGRRGPPLGSAPQTGVPATGGDSFRRLDALVAVATSESKHSTPAF